MYCLIWALVIWLVLVAIYIAIDNRIPPDPVDDMPRVRRVTHRHRWVNVTRHYLDHHNKEKANEAD